MVFWDRYSSNNTPRNFTLANLCFLISKLGKKRRRLCFSIWYIEKAVSCFSIVKDDFVCSKLFINFCLKLFSSSVEELGKFITYNKNSICYNIEPCGIRQCLFWVSVSSSWFIEIYRYSGSFGIGKVTGIDWHQIFRVIWVIYWQLC